MGPAKGASTRAEVRKAALGVLSSCSPPGTCRKGRCRWEGRCSWQDLGVRRGMGWIIIPVKIPQCPA